MKRFLICLSLLFSVSTFAAQEGRFVQKDNIFPRVEIVTSLGSIVVELDRSKAPITVNNFLTYVMDKSYQGSIFHRVERDVENDRDFVIQGGGFTFTDELVPITTKPAVVNEPVLSNVKGTIAMAKLANDENSATSQWFFNMVDNSEALDTQNGGFTVFGQITAQSQATLDNIAGLVHCGDIPLVDITSEQCSSSDVALSSANFVTINPDLADIVPWRNRNLKTEKLARATAKTLVFSGMIVTFMAILLLGYNYIAINMLERDLAQVHEQTNRAAEDLMFKAFNAMQSDSLKHMVRIQEILDGLGTLDGTLVIYEVKGRNVHWEALIPPAFAQTVNEKYSARVDDKNAEKDGRIRVQGRR